MASSGGGYCLPVRAAGAGVSAGAGPGGAVVAGAALVVFLAGVRLTGVFFAGVLFGVVALVVDTAAGLAFARVLSADVAGEAAGMGAVTGWVGRCAVAEKTSLDRPRKAAAGRAETIQPDCCPTSRF